MNYIQATSRGRELQPSLVNDTTWMYVRPGAKLAQLTQCANQMLSTSNKQGKAPGHVHYMAGIPDLTSKIRDKGYQEVVFMGTPADSVPALENEVMKTATMTKKMGWTPVFCTITPMSLTDWNSPVRTPYLIHFKQYDDMQVLLEKTIAAANHIIRAVNKSNGVYTPNLQNQIVKIHQGKVKYMYNRLTDGCHPNKQVVRQWVKIMRRAMTVNDQRKATDPWDQVRTPITDCYVGFPSDESDSDSDCETSHKRRW